MFLLNKKKLFICALALIANSLFCISIANAASQDVPYKKATVAVPQKKVTAQQLSGKVENGVRVIKVQAFRYGYTPDPIIVKEGEKVRLLLTSKDVMHGFGIIDLNIDVDIPVNKTTVLEFVPKQAGSYHIHCTVYCGVGHSNMHGELIVIK